MLNGLSLRNYLYAEKVASSDTSIKFSEEDTIMKYENIVFYRYLELTPPPSPIPVNVIAPTPSERVAKMKVRWGLKKRLSRENIVLPHFPPWMCKYGFPNNVLIRLRLYVFPDGTIDDAIVETSSGNPEYDIEVINTVKKWRCLPTVAKWNDWIEFLFTLKNSPKECNKIEIKKPKYFYSIYDSLRTDFEYLSSSQKDSLINFLKISSDTMRIKTKPMALLLLCYNLLEEYKKTVKAGTLYIRKILENPLEEERNYYKAWVYYNLGDAYYYLEQYEEAEKMYLQAKESYQYEELEDATNIGLAWIDIEREDYRNALFKFREVIKKLENSPAVVLSLFGTGIAYYNMASAESDSAKVIAEYDSALTYFLIDKVWYKKNNLLCNLATELLDDNLYYSIRAYLSLGYGANALELVDTLVQKYPKSSYRAEAKYISILLHLLGKEYDKVIENAQWIIDNITDSTFVLKAKRYIAHSFYMKENYDKCLEIWEKLYQESEEKDSIAYLWIETIYKTKISEDTSLVKKEEYLQELEKLIPNSSYLPKRWKLIGEEYMDRKENEEAIKAFNKVISLVDTGEIAVDAYLNLANIYMGKKDNEKAIETFKRITALIDTGEIAINTHLNLAEIYFDRMKDTSNAIIHWKEIMRIGDTLDVANRINWKVAAIYYKKGNWDSAAIYYERFINKFPKDEWINEAAFRTGVCYHYLNKLEKAIDFYQKVTAIERDLEEKEYSYYSYRNIGIASESLEKYKNALESYQKALSFARFGDIAEIYTHMGEIYKKLKDEDNAIKVYKKAAEHCMAVIKGNCKGVIGLRVEELPLPEIERMRYYREYCREIGEALLDLSSSGEPLPPRSAPEIPSYRSCEDMLNYLLGKLQDDSSFCIPFYNDFNAVLFSRNEYPEYELKDEYLLYYPSIANNIGVIEMSSYPKEEELLSEENFELLLRYFEFALEQDSGFQTLDITESAKAIIDTINYFPLKFLDSTNIAIEYFYRGNPKKLSKRIKDKRTAAAVCLNLGTLYLALGTIKNFDIIYYAPDQLKRAEKFYKNAIILAKKAEDKKSLLAAYHNLGILKLKEKKYKEAEKWFDRAISVEKKDMRWIYNASLYGKGIALKKRGKDEEAKEYFVKKKERR